MTEYHEPVLLMQSVDALNVAPDGIYVDVTFGGGGHSREILKRLKDGRLFGFDQDSDALANIPEDDNFIFVHHNFRFIRHFLRYHEIQSVDGILADLGVSSHHFDEADRGFSFRNEGMLDMRMNQMSDLTAQKVVNEYSQEQLSDVLFHYGELRNARKLASVIVAERQKKIIKTTRELTELVEPFFPKKATAKFLARVYQAIRIEVNGEIEVLKDLLRHGLECLKPGGRFVVITYHSLEDRLVKNFFKSGNFSGKIEKDFYGNVETPLKIIGGSVIIPDEEELDRNPRSRSAKLRVAEKL